MNDENMSNPKMGLYCCRVIHFRKEFDPMHNLKFSEGRRHTPFDIKRIWRHYAFPHVYDIGRHARRWPQPVTATVLGGFDVVVGDGG
jgi:hypothetical protein